MPGSNDGGSSTGTPPASWTARRYAALMKDALADRSRTVADAVTPISGKGNGGSVARAAPPPRGRRRVSCIMPHYDPSTPPLASGHRARASPHRHRPGHRHPLGRGRRSRPRLGGGARILSAGGNAIDAGVAAGICLGVVHPDMVSVAGVAPILVHVARTGKTWQVSGVGPYQGKSTVALLSGSATAARSRPASPRTVVPAAPDAWCTALGRGGAPCRSRTWWTPALEHAERGFPVSTFSAYQLDGQRRQISPLADLRRALSSRRAAPSGWVSSSSSVSSARRSGA